VILGLAVLAQYRRVTDGRTDNDSIYGASIASRGNIGRCSCVVMPATDREDRYSMRSRRGCGMV